MEGIASTPSVPATRGIVNINTESKRKIDSTIACYPDGVAGGWHFSHLVGEYVNAIPTSEPETVPQADQPLGILLENTTPPPPRSKYQLQDEARRILPEASVSWCLRAPLSGSAKVQVMIKEHANGQRSAHFRNVRRCGFSFGCPCCAGKIGSKRQEELEEALTAAVARGWRAYHVTFTIPHHRGDGLKELADRFQAAYTLMLKRPSWKSLAKRCNIRGSVWAAEVTMGEHGFHPHRHVIFFVEGDGAEMLAAEVLPLWQAACVAVGLRKPGEEHGVKVRPVTSGDGMAHYLTAWGAANELAAWQQKEARVGHYTPWQVLSRIADLREQGKEAEARPWERRFVEYYNAMKGKRRMVWSRGLRDELELQDTVTDQEAAEAEGQAALGGEIEHADWRRVCRFAARHIVLQLAVSGWEAVEAFLMSLRLAENGLARGSTRGQAGEHVKGQV